MTRPSLLRAGWIHVKQNVLAVMAAAVMYVGLHQVFGGLRYPLADLTMQLVNVIFMKAVRDHLPLPNGYRGIPWQYHAKIVAEGVILAVVGMFIGLWANARNQRRSSP